MNRREFLASVAAAPLAAAPVGHPSALPAQASTGTRPRARIRQSVMASVWTGANLSFEERCQILARIGFKGVDLPTAAAGADPEAVRPGAGDDDRHRHQFPGRLDPQGTARQVRRGLSRRHRHVRRGRLSQSHRAARRAPRHVARRGGRQRRGDPQPRQGLRGAEEASRSAWRSPTPRSPRISAPTRSSTASTGAWMSAGR